MFPLSSADCPHDPSAIKAVFSGRTWSAVCIGCGHRWLRPANDGEPGTVNDTPATVRYALFNAAEIAGLTAEQAHNVGIYTTAVGHPSLPPPVLVEGLRWILSPYGVQCAIHYNDIAVGVIGAFHAERSEFALVAGHHALMLAARFGRTIGWFDGAWHGARQHPHFPIGLPEPQPNQDLPVTLTLVDATTGLVAGIRQVTWPASFHRAVHQAIQTNRDNGMDETAGDREIDQWTQRHRSPDLLVLNRARARCRGGHVTAAPTSG